MENTERTAIPLANSRSLKLNREGSEPTFRNIESEMRRYQHARVIFAALAIAMIGWIALAVLLQDAKQFGCATGGLVVACGLTVLMHAQVQSCRRGLR